MSIVGSITNESHRPNLNEDLITHHWCWNKMSVLNFIDIVVFFLVFDGFLPDFTFVISFTIFSCRVNEDKKTKEIFLDFSLLRRTMVVYGESVFTLLHWNVSSLMKYLVCRLLVYIKRGSSFLSLGFVYQFNLDFVFQIFVTKWQRRVSMQNTPFKSKINLKRLF